MWIRTNQSQIIDISRIIHLAVFNYIHHIKLHTIGNKRGTIGRPNEGLISSTSFSDGNITVGCSKGLLEYIDSTINNNTTHPFATAIPEGFRQK